MFARPLRLKTAFFLRLLTLDGDGLLKALFRAGDDRTGEGAAELHGDLRALRLRGELGDGGLTEVTLLYGPVRALLSGGVAAGHV